MKINSSVMTIDNINDQVIYLRIILQSVYRCWKKTFRRMDVIPVRILTRSQTIFIDINLDVNLSHFFNMKGNQHNTAAGKMQPIPSTIGIYNDWPPPSQAFYFIEVERFSRSAIKKSSDTIYCTQLSCFVNPAIRNNGNRI